MKNLRQHILTLLLLPCIFALVSCKKNDPAIVYPAIFEVAEVKAKYDTRRYSHEGEVPLGAEYASMIANMPIFGLERGIAKGTAYLTLQREGAAYFDGPLGGDFSVQRNGTTWTFTSEQDVIIPTMAAANIYGLVSQIPKYRNEPIHTPLPEAYYRHITKEIRVATGGLTEIRIPIVAFYMIRRYDQGFTSASNYLHNEFNEAMLTGLRENDMLFIKEYELVCKVRK